MILALTITSSFVLASTHQMATVASGEPGWNQDPQVSHMDGRARDTYAAFCCFSQAICRELDRKWGNLYVNWHPFGMPALQTVDYQLHHGTNLKLGIFFNLEAKCQWQS